MVLTVPPLPNVGVTRADRPHIAWTYRGLTEQHFAADFVLVSETFQGVLDIMEALRASATVVESLTARADLVEALNGNVGASSSLSASVAVVEALACSIAVNLR